MRSISPGFVRLPATEPPAQNATVPLADPGAAIPALVVPTFA